VSALWDVKLTFLFVNLYDQPRVEPQCAPKSGSEAHCAAWSIFDFVCKLSPNVVVAPPALPVGEFINATNPFNFFGASVAALAAAAPAFVFRELTPYGTVNARKALDYAGRTQKTRDAEVNRDPDQYVWQRTPPVIGKQRLCQLVGSGGGRRAAPNTYYYDAYRVLVDLFADDPKLDVSQVYARGDSKWLHLRDFANKALNVQLLRLLARIHSGRARADTCDEFMLSED